MLAVMPDLNIPFKLHIRYYKRGHGCVLVCDPGYKFKGKLHLSDVLVTLSFYDNYIKTIAWHLVPVIIHTVWGGDIITGAGLL